MLLLLLLWEVKGAIPQSVFRAVTENDIARASLESSQWSIASDPTLKPHIPYTRFDDLPRLPLLMPCGVRVVIADYPLLRHDFPRLIRYSVEEIDAWLVTNAAWIHRGTLRLVNFPLCTTTSPQPNASRWSANARRSMVIQIDGGGLLVTKGSGCERPIAHTKPGDHSDCLSVLSDRLVEYINEKMISLALRHAESTSHTLGQYAVLDYGFDLPQRDGLVHRAGATLQQAHSRSLLPFTFLEGTRQVELEMTLRERGFASFSQRKMAVLLNRHNLSHSCHAINIQGTWDNHLADVDQFRLWDRAWEAPLCLWASCFPHCVVVLDNTSSCYIRRAKRRLFLGLELMTTMDETSPFPRDHFQRLVWERYATQSRTQFVGWIHSLVDQYERNLLTT